MRKTRSQVARTCLDNGVRVITEAMPGVPSVTVGIWVENGSRYEQRHQAGISHYLEHLFFKGTERRTAAQIAEEFDAVGGVLNAFTGKEYTCYYGKVLAEHLPVAEDILADIFGHSRFDPEEIERERTVVLQEISQVEDTPDDYVHDLFNLRFWPEHPLSFPVCGRVETVQSFAQQDFLDFVAARYRPDRIIIAAAGNLQHKRLVEWAAREFGSLQGLAATHNGAPPVAKRGVSYIEKALEQVHLCLGTPGISQSAEERYAGYLLNTALGGGMSSRLFQEVREKRGRAYSVYSFLSSYLDAGYLGIYVGTSAEWVEEVVSIILAELKTLKKEGLRPDELTRVKNQLKGNLLLGLETSDNRMSRIAKNEIYFGMDIEPQEVAARIDATTNEAIIALANQLVRPEATAITLLGDFKGKTVGDDLLSAA
ncbi:MAG TPA: pitrilysin family protein [Candidatus Margulisiibacteriota bacterium]|nr:pitrilysin family protein [Candidatus Margulisiibacteriota bacterium]